jgi:phosphoenolpyruvate---glycerone phosphotransferase subunit DhaK
VPGGGKREVEFTKQIHILTPARLRRGVAGTLIVEKVLGAAAEEGRNLDDLKALGDRVNAATRSIGIALTSCTVPAAGKPTFDLGEDEMEVGVGIHGEPGRRRIKLKSANEIAAEMVGAITADLGNRVRGEVILLVNGFGGTPLSELYLMYDSVTARVCGLRHRALARRQLRHLARHGRVLGDGVAAR